MNIDKKIDGINNNLKSLNEEQKVIHTSLTNLENANNLRAKHIERLDRNFVENKRNKRAKNNSDQ